jgi:cell division protein YceG involved in septum cleavage
MRKSIKVIIVMLLLGVSIRAYYNHKTLNGKNQINYISYTVKSGDTIYNIAKDHKPEGKKLNNYIVEIQVKNNINEVIKPGDRILIPVIQ